MILCYPQKTIKTPHKKIKKLLELINEFSNVTGYKINIKKLMVFLYTNNEITKRENNVKSHL